MWGRSGIAIVLAVVGAAVCVAGCRSQRPDADGSSSATASGRPPPPASVSASSAAPPAPPSAVDEVFQRYRQTLPPAETLSQQNGVSLKCDQHGHTTYTRLEMASAKVPLETDADVARLVPWSRDPDPCLRQIAMDAILRKVAYDSNRLVLPSMHEPDHYLHHDILSSTKTWLASRQVAHDAKVFDGLMLDISDGQFVSWMKGRWEEEVDKKWKNFQYLVDFDGERLRVVHDRTKPDPEWPVSTSTARIAEVRVNENRQWLVSIAWTEESSSRGYQGKRVEPSDRVYTFWPVHEDVVWFDNASPKNWSKLRRVK